MSKPFEVEIEGGLAGKIKLKVVHYSAYESLKLEAEKLAEFVQRVQIFTPLGLTAEVRQEAADILAEYRKHMPKEGQK